MHMREYKINKLITFCLAKIICYKLNLKKKKLLKVLIISSYIFYYLMK